MHSSCPIVSHHWIGQTHTPSLLRIPSKRSSGCVLFHLWLSLLFVHCRQVRVSFSGSRVHNSKSILDMEYIKQTDNVNTKRDFVSLCSMQLVREKEEWGSEISVHIFVPHSSTLKVDSCQDSSLTFPSFCRHWQPRTTKRQTWLEENTFHAHSCCPDNRHARNVFMLRDWEIEHTLPSTLILYSLYLYSSRTAIHVECLLTFFISFCFTYGDHHHAFISR
jgi:hypothetical protein